MPKITLPDNSVKEFPGPVTAHDVAKSIGAGLAKAALGCKIDGELRDLSTVIDRDCTLSIVTPTNRDKTVNPDALFLMRHSAAHVMAEAIQDVIGKDVLLAYGPPTETGFFYDMYVPPGKSISTDHFPAINARMAAIIREDRTITRYELRAEEGLGRLAFEGNQFKIDNAARAVVADLRSRGLLNTNIESASQFKSAKPLSQADALRVTLRQHNLDTILSFYATGTPLENWEDLCRGPHVPSTGRIGAACVMSLASSYWHGDENSDRLTRVYGTAFASQAELDAHLAQLQQAKERDHRVIGKRLHLFHIDETVGQGLILWTPKGSVIRNELQNFISQELVRQGYTQVYTPHIGKLELYKTSAHFPYYKESQFAPIIENDSLAKAIGEGCSCAEMANRLAAVSSHFQKQMNERTRSSAIPNDWVMPDEKLLDGFLLKPMNCPHHAKIFASSPHSYRDMPARLSEFGTVYRWEQSGELNGMTRVRGFTQDDAHLFCTPEQIPAELLGCLELVKIIFTTLGMKGYRVRVGLRDKDSAKYIGDAANWDVAEQACRDAAKSLGVSFVETPGEAAFYGPKIDFMVKDVIGREWQLGTVQVDYNMAIRFDLSYIGPDNKPHRPVVIHRAPFGSMERFIGVLIEHFAGAFPTWLSAEQVRILPISEKTNDYAADVLAYLKSQVSSLRCTIDASNDRIQAKIKVAAEEKIPYLLIVGPRDAESRSVSLRIRGVEKDAGSMPLDQFAAKLKTEIEQRSATLTMATH